MQKYLAKNLKQGLYDAISPVLLMPKKGKWKSENKRKEQEKINSHKITYFEGQYDTNNPNAHLQQINFERER